MTPITPTDTTAVLTFSAVSVFVIQKLKQAKWFTLITPDSKTMNTIASAVAAALAATGVHIAFASDTGTLTVTGLSMTTIGAGAWAWLKSFVLNEWIYQSTRQAGTPGVTPPPQKQ